MKSLRNHLLSDSPVTSSGIGFDPQIGGRRFRTLNKDHLQAEEEENTRKMEKKMFQNDESMLWFCRDCSWKNFRRHGKEMHENAGKLNCSLCPYSTSSVALY